MAKEIEEQLPVKFVSLFSKVNSHRTEKEMTQENKYDIQRDNTENINSKNINDSDGRSIMQNQDGRQSEGQHTAYSWTYNN